MLYFVGEFQLQVRKWKTFFILAIILKSLSKTDNQSKPDIHRREEKSVKQKMCFIDKINKVKSLANVILGRKRQDQNDQYQDWEWMIFTTDIKAIKS